MRIRPRATPPIGVDSQINSSTEPERAVCALDRHVVSGIERARRIPGGRGFNLLILDSSALPPRQSSQSAGADRRARPDGDRQ